MREGSYMETSYCVGARRSPSALPPTTLAQLEGDPNCLKDLRRLCKLLSAEEVQEAYDWRYKDWHSAWHPTDEELEELAWERVREEAARRSQCSGEALKRFAERHKRA